MDDEGLVGRNCLIKREKPLEINPKVFTIFPQFYYLVSKNFFFKKFRAYLTNPDTRILILAKVQKCEKSHFSDIKYIIKYC